MATPEDAACAGGTEGLTMTATEFEHEYAERSGLTVEELRQANVILACACGEEGVCRGWAAVPNDPLSIKAHNRLYGPKD